MIKEEREAQLPHAGTVTVLLPPKIANHFERVMEVQKDILGRLGHPGCYSSRDFIFRFVREEMFVATEQGVVSALHG
jgi:hypothetical protein